MRTLTAADAFCGSGGLSIGLKAAGFDVKLSFDIEETCIKTLSNNPRYISHNVLQADVRDMLNGQFLKNANINKGDLDLLAGGPPCQGFSVQRTIGEDKDSRNLLVDDYGDLIEEVFPRFFLLENVPGIGGKRGRKIIDSFEDRMDSLGYYCHRNILDAQNYGVPQRRRRFLMVGERRDYDKPLFSWPLEAHAPSLSVRDTIQMLPPPPLGGKDHIDYPGHRADRLSALNLERIRSIKDGQARQDLPKHLLAKCHRVSADKIGHRNVYGRMAWDEVAPTITARFDSFTRGKFGHPEQDRSISLYEGALLQTFPKDYVFTGTKVQIARQIGNAVPPNFAKALGEAVKSCIESLEALK